MIQTYEAGNGIKIMVDGKSEYDTNNYSINLEKLLEIPKVKRYPSTKKRYRKSFRGVMETKLVCHGDSESIIYPSINIPAIAGDKLCETCEGDKMCETCEKYKIAKDFANSVGTKFKGLETHYSKMLESMEDFHNGEELFLKGDGTTIPVQPVSKSSVLFANSFSGSNEYTEKVSEYPETVQKSVKLFAETFKLSPSAIPKKSKGKGGMFATWVKGIQDLQQIAGNERRFKLVLDKVHDVWENRSAEFKTHIDMPQKIRGSFVTMESELTQEEEKKEKEIAENVQNAKIEKEVYITDNEDTRKQAVADLKKQMRNMK